MALSGRPCGDERNEERRSSSSSDRPLGRCSVSAAAALFLALFAGCRGAGTLPVISLASKALPVCVSEHRRSPLRPSDTLSARASFYTSRAGWIAASRAIPGGFAGFSFDPDTKGFIIRLVDPSQKSAAVQAIGKLLAAGPASHMRAISAAELGGAIVEQVRWSVPRALRLARVFQQ